MKLPNVKKSNKIIIDCNGISWIYIEEKEIFLVNKDGMQIIKFDDLDKETLQHILEEEIYDISFKTGKEVYSIDDIPLRVKTAFETLLFGKGLNA